MVVARRRAVFLDRDGTLIRNVNYLCRVEQIDVLPGVAPALRLMRNAGLKLIMITNQSAIARGYLSETLLQEIHRELTERLERDGAGLDAIYYCPHHPTEGQLPYRATCVCRKPNTGMIDRAAAELGLDPKTSYMIGDQLIDMELAAAVGARGILLDSGVASLNPPLSGQYSIAADLAQAARSVLTQVLDPGVQ